LSGSEPGVLHDQRDLDPIVGVELRQHAGDVGLDGRDAHVQLRGDVGVGLSLSDRLGDLALSVGERVQALTGRGPARVAIAWWQFAISAALSVVCTVGVARLAMAVYRRSMLRTGARVRLRDLVPLRQLAQQSR